MSNQSPEDLLARTALGDRRAFEHLYSASAPQLFGLVLRIVRQQDLASEILQEGFIKIWQRAGDYRSDKAKAITWMGTIVRNQAIDQLRRRRTAPTSDANPDELDWIADEGEGPQDQVSREQSDQTLQRCLERLEGDQRQAMQLAYFGGLTHEELADRLGRPLGTVKSWIRRGLQRLKTCLDEA